MQYKRRRENASKVRLHFNTIYLSITINTRDVLYADIIMNTIILLTHLFKHSISYSFLYTIEFTH